MNQDINGNKKLFWKEMGKKKEREVENFIRIKVRLAVEKVDVQETWEDYLKKLYKVKLKSWLQLMCSFEDPRQLEGIITFEESL